MPPPRIGLRRRLTIGLRPKERSNRARPAPRVMRWLRMGVSEGSWLSPRVPRSLQEPGLLLERHAPEAGALGLVVEALHVLAHGPEAEQVPVADDRDLLVERLRHLHPELVALLGVGL